MNQPFKLFNEIFYLNVMKNKPATYYIPVIHNKFIGGWNKSEAVRLRKGYYGWLKDNRPEWKVFKKDLKTIKVRLEVL